MAVDLTGGLAPEQDLMLGAAPDDPEMRQGVSIWISSDEPGVGIPRIGLEAVGGQWDRLGYSVQVAFPDGRVLVTGGAGAPSAPEGPAGWTTVMGAGGLEMRCVEPFRRWTTSYEGPAVDTTVHDQMAKTVDRSRTTTLSFHVDMEMAVPPWIQGTMGEAAKQALSGGQEAAFMGGWRFEQLFRGRGTVTAGEDTSTFTCTGLRINRRGVRDTTGFFGHCWQSALFPSGRAFGYIAYPPEGGGPPTYAEAYLFEGDGELIPATLVDAPWMTRFEPLGGSVPCAFESKLGTTRIEGDTFVSVLHNEIPDFPSLHQGGARYRWDGEETFGMIERSYPEHLMT